MRKQIRKAMAGDLDLYDTEGFTGSVTVSIYKENALWRGAEVLAPSSAYATTVSDAKHRSNTLELDSGVGFHRGQVATIIPPSGVRFDVSIIGVQGDVITLESPLRTLLPIGTHVQENRVSFSLTPTETASNERDLRVLWTYSNGLGSLKNISTYFDVVEDPWDPGISLESLSHIDPTINEYLGGNISLKQSAAGAKGQVETLLRSGGQIPDLYRYRDGLNYIVSLFTLSTLSRAAKNEEKALAYSEQARLLLKGVQESTAWYDLNEDMIKDEKEARPPIHWIRVG